MRPLSLMTLLLLISTAAWAQLMGDNRNAPSTTVKIPHE